MEPSPQAQEGRNRDQSAQHGRKREFQGGRGPKRQRTRKEKPIKEGSNNEVLLTDVCALFAAQKLSETVIPATVAGDSPSELIEKSPGKSSKSLEISDASEAENEPGRDHSS